MNITELDQFNLRDAVRFHNRLNPRLWGSDEHLHPEVQQALMAIAEDFREFLGIKNLEIKDITISGSNAAYNYTPTSDIDLHLVVDIPEMAQDVYQELFNAKKYQYNNQHRITIGDSDVELYVQPADQPHISQGIYSLLDRDWVSIPRRKRARIDDSSVKHKYEDLTARIDDAIKTHDEDTISAIIHKIKSMRSAGLEQNGEFGTENLVYKLLRTNGYIQKLYDAKNAAHSQDLSIEEDFEDPPTYQRNIAGIGKKTPRFDTRVIERYFDAIVPSLNIQNPPRLIMHRDPSWSEQNSSFGRYDPETNTLHLSVVGRHEMDVLRTMAHELTHCRQNELGMLDDDSGETGSPEENQANAVAGQIMRHVGRANPGHFRIEPTLGTPSVEDPEDQEVYEQQPALSNDYYDQLAQKYAKEHGVPISMVRHVMNKETGHIQDPAQRAQAQSKRGAQGIMQLKPITQREMGVTDPHDPDQNIRGGVQYLGKQLQRFKDPVLAMAAYNAGPANVDKYGGVPPFRQTQGYVAGYQPDPIKPMPEPAKPGMLDTIKQTGYEWLRGAGDFINRATAPKSLDARTMQPTATNESASGYIPTAKEKNDPRYQMALTVDIQPGQLGKEANKMALQTDSQGRPALLRASGKK